MRKGNTLNFHAQKLRDVLEPSANSSSSRNSLVSDEIESLENQAIENDTESKQPDSPTLEIPKESTFDRTLAPMNKYEDNVSHRKDRAKKSF